MHGSTVKSRFVKSFFDSGGADRIPVGGHSCFTTVGATVVVVVGVVLVIDVVVVVVLEKRC